MIVAAIAPACDDESKREAAETKPAATAAAAAPAPAAAKPSGGAKDRGDGTVTMDGRPWAAERCSARVKASDGGGETLTVSCSHTATSEGAVNREELVLVVADFKGAATYTTGGSSRYVSVGVDTAAAKAAQGDEAKNTVVTDSIRGSTYVDLKGAQVIVSAASESAIDGSFQWSPAAGKEGPTLTDGKFHAVRKD